MAQRRTGSGAARGDRGGAIAAGSDSGVAARGDGVPADPADAAAPSGSSSGPARPPRAAGPLGPGRRRRSVTPTDTEPATPSVIAGPIEVSTPFGPARYLLHVPAGFDLARPSPLLMLGHGAGGDVDAADLVAVKDAAVGAGVAVALVTQPYRVAGRRAPAPANQLDVAWLAVVAALRTGMTVGDLVVGGRSSGARVACRTAAEAAAARIVALAFPLHPPGRPEKSRAGELETGVATLVLNGDRDAFGVPEPGPGVDVVVLPGETHALSKNPGAVAAAALPFILSGVTTAGGASLSPT